jgi:Helix-turn-helix domain
MPMAKKLRDPQEESEPREVSARWTAALTSGGWTPVADFFLDSYAKLDPRLTNAEAMLVIHLIRHKWDEAPPFPGFTTLAKRMGISPTAARAHARSLENKGYLLRHMRVGTTNKFDLGKLFTALEKLQAFELGKKEGKTGRLNRSRIADI